MASINRRASRLLMLFPRSLLYSAISLTANQLPGLLFWLTAYDPSGTGLQPADGDPISTWVDRSGNNHNFSQVTGSLQPKFKAAATPNGLPAIVGDDTQYLLCPTALDVKTVVAVVYYDEPTISSHQTFLGGYSSAGAAGAYYFKVDDSLNHSAAVVSGATKIANTTSAIKRRSWTIYQSRTNTDLSNVSLELDGNSAATFDTYTGGLVAREAPTSLFCGLTSGVAADIAKIKIAEIFAFDRLIAAPEYNLLAKYLSMQYKIPMYFPY